MAPQRRRTGAPSHSDPTRLSPFDGDQPDLVHVVIETPKGSRNKYAFDPRHRVFALKRVLPAGMAFPYDFGFVPSTRADDGDPVDVLVIMDEPAFPGCLLTCRLIGVILGEQRDRKKKKRVRNDRIVAIEAENRSFEDIKTLDDLGEAFCDELADFFVNYHQLSDSDFEVLGQKGPKAARKLIEASRRG